jgi:hypothetical protein
MKISRTIIALYKLEWASIYGGKWETTPTKLGDQRLVGNLGNINKDGRRT